MSWETPNPDWWVPRGYAIVRVDQRGVGASPGWLGPFSAQQAVDYFDAIEWAAIQPWSSGKVGLLGISYYALTQWEVAALQPPHLTAIIPWEGMLDLYRDTVRHGGILSTFRQGWFYRQILPVQYGADGRLSPEVLAANRTNLLGDFKLHTLDDAYYHLRMPDTSRITVPLLSVGNWGGFGNHLRGNIEGYVHAASEHKWLRVHVGTHFTPFYSQEGRAVQKRFLDYWLKDDDNGLLSDPPIQIAVRKGTGFTWRDEQEWPLARTQWTRFYLDAALCSLQEAPPSAEEQLSYQALEAGATFTTAPFEADTEITGPLALHIWVSASTTELDLFVTIRNLDVQGNEVSCIGTTGEAAPVAKGWLRASRRKLDTEQSLPYRPYHSHDEVQLLTPGEIVLLDVEIWPTCMVFETGHRLALDLEAHDGMGSVPFLHADPDDRPLTVFAGTNTIYSGGQYASYLLLPIIPNR
jgi:predicted acyl esterase